LYDYGNSGYELYRHYNSKGHLLYVGISNSTALRTNAHSNTSAWWPEVTRIEIERFRSRNIALEAERHAIIEEHPIHNRMHARKEPRPIVVKNPADVTPSNDAKAERIAYTIPEAAEALGVSRAHVYNLIREGRLRSVKFGRSRRIPATALAEMIA